MAPPGRDDTLTLAVLGDSTAAGLGDPVEPGLFRGFGPLLAAALGAPDRVRLVNTGCSGARVACVRRVQLPRAVAARPHLAVLLVGINDTLHADFDPVALRADLDAVLARLTGAGALVLGVRYHHHGRVLPLPGPAARALDARIDRLNEVIDRVLREHGAPCLDLAALPVCYQPATWSIDRLHPSPRGHRALARALAELASAAGHVVDPSVLDGGDDRLPTRAEELHWLLTQGIPWLGRRSRDLLPLLLTVASRRALSALRDASAVRPAIVRTGRVTSPAHGLPAAGWPRRGRR